jgi:hypothetical protein
MEGAAQDSRRFRSTKRHLIRHLDTLLHLDDASAPAGVATRSCPLRGTCRVRQPSERNWPRRHAGWNAEVRILPPQPASPLSNAYGIWSLEMPRDGGVSHHCVFFRSRTSSTARVLRSRQRQGLRHAGGEVMSSHFVSASEQTFCGRSPRCRKVLHKTHCERCQLFTRASCQKQKPHPSSWRLLGRCRQSI